MTGEKKGKGGKGATANNLWVPPINNHGAFGRWALAEVAHPWDAANLLRFSLIRNTTKARTSRSVMALKGKEWFYKRCLQEVERHGRFCHLCWDILKKGIGQSDSTRGHVTQAIGVSQEFLGTHSDLVTIIQAADPTRPFDVPGNPRVQEALRAWLEPRNGLFGRQSFGYNYDTFKNIVTRALGGTRRGGGGGDDEFKRVLRLMAEFRS
ncbi:MAG: hypothetical protein WD847_13735 [Pirellulales bacterium]